MKSLLKYSLYVCVASVLLFKSCKFNLGFWCPDKDMLMGELSDEDVMELVDIKRERRMVAMKSFVLGLVAGVAYVMFLSKSKGTTCQLVEIVGMACLLSSIFYKLMPKPQLLVVNLDSKAKRIAWAENYNSYSSLQTYGEIIGLLMFTLFK